MNRVERLQQYAYLMRLNKPIGIFLLLWPTLWALWLASAGRPQPSVVVIFVLGVIVMRSAGCVINDFADRHLDGRVQRTCNRPLPAGKISVTEALGLFLCLSVIAFFLVLFLNRLTLCCAFVGAAITLFYPFMKRFTHLPQLGLGLAFTWGIPMAFAAQRGTIPGVAWFLFATAILWPLIYDTFYAMADREDDLKVGIKSTAILFAGAERRIIALLQFLFLAGLYAVGLLFQLAWPYYTSLVLVAVLFAYQHYLIRALGPAPCLKAFMNNNAVGALIFMGIVCSYAQDFF
jgi:4-hydroxybenzoate polyprenyltransferase